MRSGKFKRNEKEGAKTVTFCEGSGAAKISNKIPNSMYRLSFP